MHSPSVPRQYKSAMQCPLLVVLRLGAKSDNRCGKKIILVDLQIDVLLISN